MYSSPGEDRCPGCVTFTDEREESERRKECVTRGCVCFRGVSSDVTVTKDVPEDDTLDLVLLVCAGLQSSEGWALAEVFTLMFSLTCFSQVICSRRRRTACAGAETDPCSEGWGSPSNLGRSGASLGDGCRAQQRETWKVSFIRSSQIVLRDAPGSQTGAVSLSAGPGCLDLQGPQL